MKTKIRPLGDRLLVRRLEDDKEQRTSGGIIIPDTAKEKPMQGEIKAIGPGKRPRRTASCTSWRSRPATAS